MDETVPIDNAHLNGDSVCVSMSDNLKLLVEDIKIIKTAAKKEKQAKYKLCACLSLVVIFQILLFMVAFGGLYYRTESFTGTITPKTDSSVPEAVAAPLMHVPIAASLVSDTQTSPLQKYHFNVGLRSDYKLQECQGPDLKRSFPDVDYAFLGYDVLKGYPLDLGHDPGFTLPIFSADYSAGHMTADCHFSVPQGIVLIPDVSCITSFTSDVVENSRELSKSLSASAQVSGRRWGVRFSASAGYEEASSKLASGESVYIISRASCNYYYMKLVQRDPPPFHPVFLDWILELDKTNDEDKYLEFLENYGTHFSVEMEFGAAFTYEHQMSARTYKEEKEKGVNVGVSASYSGLYSVGRGSNMDSSHKAAASYFQKKVTTRTITIGAPPPSDGDAMTWASTVKESPVPVMYKLQSIEELFTETYMENDYMRPYSIHFTRIRENIQNVKQRYCERVHVQGSVHHCEGQSELVTLDKTNLHGQYILRRGFTLEQCVNECYDLDECVAVTRCHNCGHDSCLLYLENESVIISVHDEAFTAVVLLPKIKNVFQISYSTIDSTNKLILPKRTRTISMLAECEAECSLQTQCVAFTYRDDQNEKCTLHSGEHMSLFRQLETHTYFIGSSTRVALFGKIYGSGDSSLLHGQRVSDIFELLGIE